MNTTQVVLGHELCLKSKTRGVMLVKQARLHAALTPLLTSNRWNRKVMGQSIGLAESIKDDVVRRWRLGPLYKVLHSPGNEEWAVPSQRARASIKKILETMRERRSMLWRPTTWTFPRDFMVCEVPNTDAAQQIGYGGVYWEGDIMYYFQGEWSTLLKNARVNIAVLEAWAIVMAAATWGHKFAGKKIIFRTDSSPSCFCLNKLWSKLPEMEIIVNLWEDLQFHFNFEALVLFCPGKENHMADMASRSSTCDVQACMEAEATKRGLQHLLMKRVEVKWVVGEMNLDVEDQLLAFKMMTQRREHHGL